MTGEELAYLGRETCLVPLYAHLRKNILDLYPKSEIRVHKTMISFRHPMPFCYVSLPTRPLAKEHPDKYLAVSLLLSERVEHPRIAQIAEPYPGRFTHHLMLSQFTEVDPLLLRWIQQSHNFRYMVTGGKGRG